MFVIVSPVQGANVFMQWHDLHILTEQVVLCFKTFFFLSCMITLFPKLVVFKLN